MNTYHVDAWMAFPPHGMTRLASMLILMLAWSVGDGAAFASTSNRPIGVLGAGRPPVAQQPPDHTPMPSARRPAGTAVVEASLTSGGAAVPFGAADTVGQHDSDQTQSEASGSALLPDAGSERLIRPRRLGKAGIEAAAPPGAAGWWLNTAWALALVVVIIVALRFVLQRLGHGSATRQNAAVMEIVGRVSTGPRSAVLALRVGHRIVIVGQTANGLSPLADVSDPNEVAEVLAAAATHRSGSVSRGFATIFNHANRSYDEAIHNPNEAGDLAEFDIDRARDEVGGLLSRVRSMAGRAS